MPTPEQISAALTAPFDPSEIEIKSGNVFLPHEIVRARLIAATANVFDWSIDQILFRDDGATRRAPNQSTGEIPRPIAMVVLGTLSIPGLGSRAGIGTHPIDAGAGEDAAYKSAESDALKRAAMGFGVGLDQLYINATATKRETNGGSRPATGHSGGLSDQQFAERIRAAVDSENGAEFRRLVDQCGDHIGRWVIVAKNVSPAAAPWVRKRAESAGVLNDVLERELEKRIAPVAAELPL
jgi:hypothetical protein